jgi:uncharacterized RDD family membrane protein YckC
MKTSGIGARVINFLIDTTIIMFISIIGFSVWNWYVKYYSFTYHNFWVIFAMVVFVYYLLFESFFARTPGKWFSFTKVVTRQGKKPSVAIIFVRSLSTLIVIDMFFIPFLDKTLHDYLSGTEVVEV